MKRIIGLSLWLASTGCAHLPVEAPHTPAPVLSASELYARGVQAMTAGDLTRAEQYLTLAERAGHASSQVLPLLLEICVGASRYRAALSHAEAHLARSPDNPRLRQLVGTFRSALGAYAPKSSTSNPERPMGTGQPADPKEERDDPGRHTPPEPDAAATPGHAPLG